jgi:hypothetical protein
VAVDVDETFKDDIVDVDVDDDDEATLAANSAVL